MLKNFLLFYFFAQSSAFYSSIRVFIMLLKNSYSKIRKVNYNHTDHIVTYSVQFNMLYNVSKKFSPKRTPLKGLPCIIMITSLFVEKRHQISVTIINFYYLKLLLYAIHSYIAHLSASKYTDLSVFFLLNSDHK